MLVNVTDVMNEDIFSMSCLQSISDSHQSVPLISVHLQLKVLYESLRLISRGQVNFSIKSSVKIAERRSGLRMMELWMILYLMFNFIR